MRPLLIALLVLAVAAPAASARPARSDPTKSPDLWATVNVCDTEAHPDQIGIRASMPGIGRRARLWMRFRVQYLSPADGEWHAIRENADSGYRSVGRTRRQVLESGHTFTFLPPESGVAHTMRGIVTFAWRKRSRTLRRVREVTESGHRSTAGADPPGFSAAICQIS